MKVVLELQDQPSNVRRITVRHDIVIGRGSDCNLRLSSPQVSRRHCFLRVGRDSVSVTDLDSSNGTFVDGKRITSGKRHDLANGTQLALGPIRFLIHVQGTAVAADKVQSNIAGAVANNLSRTDSGSNLRDSRSTTADGSTHLGGPVDPDSGEMMNYSLEHGGATADAHETTSDCIGSRMDLSDEGEKFSTEPPLSDSRVEIIDFGRQLAELGISDEDAANASSEDPAVESVLNGEARLWEPMTEGDSDDIDVLSIGDDHSDELPLAALPSDMIAENVEEPLQVSDASADLDELDEVLEFHETVEDEDVVELDETIDVIADVPNETLESATDQVVAENTGEDGESRWIGVDSDDPVENPDDDDVDDELQDFLKGF